MSAILLVAFGPVMATASLGTIPPEPNCGHHLAAVVADLPADWTGYVASLEKAYRTPADAAKRAEGLETTLKDLLDLWRVSRGSRQEEDAARRLVVETLLATSLLHGSGFSVETTELSLAARGGLAPAAYVDAIGDRLAKASRTEPGTVHVPTPQFVDADGKVLPPAKWFTADDKTNREISDEYLRLLFEEHFHVAYLLRSYAGRPQWLSNWAATCTGCVPDRESDVMALLEERLGPLPARWRARYRSRQQVPVAAPDSSR